MTLARFSMVEELASLVKDNIPCKYLILSVEDMLVNYLQDDTGVNGVLNLEPMDPYSRLLVHRLAEIFGFSHYSVGDGEDRHLVLERSPETSIPGILVNDLLQQYGEIQSPMTYDVLRRKEDFPGQKVDDDVSGGPSLDDRETAYFAARQRIFSEDACDSKVVKERLKKDPVVARRMITRALGQADKGERSLPDKNPRAPMMSKLCKSGEFRSEDGLSKEPQQNNLTEGNSSAEKNKDSQDNYLRQEHMGAAKRLFANALRRHGRNASISKTHETKETGC